MGNTRSWAGLTARQVVSQSQLIHPDWDGETHSWYLVTEEGFDAGMVENLPIPAWLAEGPVA